MNIILENPFRILGLPITSSQRDIVKRVSDLEIFVQMGKTKEYDHDFPQLSVLSRTLDTIEQASKLIEGDEARLLYSLFWFWKKTNVDDLALDVLKDGNWEKALALWEKAIGENAISDKTCSHFKNASLLHFIMSLKKTDNIVDHVSQGIKHFCGFIDSKYLSGYFKEVIEDIRTVESAKIITSSLDKIHDIASEYLDKENGISSKDYLSAFKGFSQNIRHHINDKVINRPIAFIESEIEKCSKIRKDNYAKAINAGKDLFVKTKENVGLLNSILSVDDIQYQMTLDNLAEELLSCAIDYGNKSDDSFSEEDSIELAKNALTVAKGDVKKDRINKNISTLERLIKDKLHKRKSQAVLEQVRNLGELRKQFPDVDKMSFEELAKLPEIVLDMLKQCQPGLTEIKTYCYCMEAEECRLFFEEDFSDNDNKWTVSEVYKIRDGNYVVENANGESAFIAFMDRDLDIHNLSSFTLRIKIRMVEGIGGPIWGYTSVEGKGRFQGLFLSSDNSYKIADRTLGDVSDGTWKSLPENVNEDNEQEIVIKKKDNTVQLFANDVQFESIDSIKLPGGKIGFFINSKTEFTVLKVDFYDVFIEDLDRYDNHLFYMKISSSIASEALDRCVDFANKTNDYNKLEGVVKGIGGLDMLPGLRERFIKNMETLQKMMQAQAATAQTTAISKKWTFGRVLKYAGIGIGAIWILGAVINSMNEGSSSTPSSTDQSSSSSSSTNTQQAGNPSTPATIQKSDDDYVIVGQYRCTRYNSQKADELRPNADLNTRIDVESRALKYESSEIETEQASIESESAEIDLLSSDINTDYVDRTDQSSIDDHNSKIDDYNSKLQAYRYRIAGYNSKIEEHRTKTANHSALVDQYNAQVEVYNNFLQANCTKCR
jgi:hypothetical protein